MTKFSTHLLTMTEVWWVREHPFNVLSVRVKKAVQEVEALETQLEVKRIELMKATKELSTRMFAEADAKDSGKEATTLPKYRRIKREQSEV